MSATRTGAIIFLIMILALVACAVVTFVVMPTNGISTAMPVITVPGEAYNGKLPSEELNFTNTVMATLLADAAVLIFVLLAWRASRGWTREVPTRFQAWVELIAEFVYNQTKSFAGNKPLALNYLFPLAATIFVFLLAANWMKLLPGIESVGILHCAHAGVSGYPAVQIGNDAYQLYSDRALNAGQGATEDDYHHCHEFLDYISEKMPAQAALASAATHLAQEEAALIASFTPAQSEAERTALIDALRLEATESVYDHPSFALTAEQLQKGVLPYVMVVTPYVRGAATDLNLTIGLALITVVAVQVFGVAAQGPGYFQKFINLRALGTMSKKPLGAVDFLVGIFEIVSEIGKIISLAFRLFGNMFAGGILLAVMSFLVAFILPVIFYGLEVIITSIQAFVFAVLTIVFAAQAMEGHHGDDDHDHGDDHGEAAEHA